MKRVFVIEVPEQLREKEKLDTQAAIAQQLRRAGLDDFEILIFDAGWKFRELPQEVLPVAGEIRELAAEPVESVEPAGAMCGPGEDMQDK